jgi:hypothetical protein
MPEGLEERWKRSVRAYHQPVQPNRDGPQVVPRYHKAQAHRHRVLSDALVARHENEGPALHGPWAPKMTGYRWQHR